MGVLLGLVVAAAYGTADFLGGLGSRRLPVAAVLVVGQATGLVLVTSIVLLTDGHAFDGDDLVLGAAAGIGGFVGLALLFRGLARGHMAVVAPVTAVGSALTPFTWALATGERPGGLALMGVAVAVVGVGVVARPSADALRSRLGTRDLVLAVIAGIAFGTVFIVLDGTSSTSGLAPIVASRLVTVPLAAVWLGWLVVRRGWRPTPGSFAPASLALLACQGVFDSSANAVFMAATRRGLLSEVAVVSALYPAATALLAAVVLGERITRPQRVGLALALAGVVLLAL